MSEFEKIKNSKLIYQGRAFDLYEDEIILRNGKKANCTWLDHGPTVAVVPVNEKKELFLIRQYRHATKKTLIEIPAGNMEKTESVEDCVQRELAEEIGYKAGKITRIYEGYLLPGYGNEYMYFYLAQDLYEEKLPADEDENIEVFTVTLAEALTMIKRGEIIDAKTALGIYLVQELIG